MYVCPVTLCMIGYVIQIIIAITMYIKTHLNACYVSLSSFSFGFCYLTALKTGFCLSIMILCDKRGVVDVN